jgi:hypothetical protein
MGAGDSTRASLHARLMTAPVLRAQFGTPCKNLVSSERSDGDLRSVVGDFRLKWCHSTMWRLPADFRRRQGRGASGNSSRQRSVGLNTGVICSFKGQTFKSATTLLMYQELAS